MQSDFNQLLDRAYRGKQAALADDIGYSRAQVNAWATGKKRVPLVVLKYMRLRVLLSDFLDGYTGL